MADKNTDFGVRLTQIRVTFCENKTRLFAQKTGINEQMLANYCSGLRTPGKKTLEKILTAFPMINAEWLLLGKGEMLSKQPTESWFDKRYMNEPVAVPIGMYEAVIRENERLRMENERLREKLRLLSGETAEGRILPSGAI